MPTSPPAAKLDIPAWNPDTEQLTYVAASDVPELRKAGILTGEDAELRHNRGGLGGTVASFVAGAPAAITGGYSDDALPAITRHLGHTTQHFLGFSDKELANNEAFQAALAQTREQHGVADALGRIAGTAALFTPVGEVAEGAAGVARLAGIADKAYLVGKAGMAARVGTAALLGGLEAVHERQTAKLDDPVTASALMQGAVFGGLMGVGGEAAGSVLGKLATRAQRGTARWLDDAALSGEFRGVKGTERTFDQIYPNKSPDVKEYYADQLRQAGITPRDIEDIRFARRLYPEETIHDGPTARTFLKQEDLLSAGTGVPRARPRSGDALTPLQSGEIPGILTPDEIDRFLPKLKAARQDALGARVDARLAADEENAAREARMAPFLEAHGLEADKAAAELDPTASRYNARLAHQRETFLADARRTNAESGKLSFLQGQADALSKDVKGQKFRFSQAGGAEPAPGVELGAGPAAASDIPTHPENIATAIRASQEPGISLPDQRIIKRQFTDEEKALRKYQEDENQFRISMHPVWENGMLEQGNALTDPKEIEAALAAGTHIKTPKGNVIPDYPENMKIFRRERATYRGDDPAAPVGAGPAASRIKFSVKPGEEAEAPSLRNLSKDTLKKLRERPPSPTSPPIPPELDALMQAHAAAENGPIHGLPDVPGFGEPDAVPSYAPFTPPTPELITEQIPGARAYNQYRMRRPHIWSQGMIAHWLGEIPSIPIPGTGVKFPLGKILQKAKISHLGLQVASRYGTQFALNHEALVNGVLQRAVAPMMKGLSMAVRTGIEAQSTKQQTRGIDELGVPVALTDPAFDAVRNNATRLAANPDAIQHAMEQQLGHVTDGRPQLHENLAKPFVAGVKFLAEEAPQPSGPSGALDGSSPSFPRSVKRNYLEKYMGVINPVAALQAPTQANMKAVQAVHPDLLDYYRKQIQEQLSDPKVAARVMANPDLRRRLSLVMGVPMSRSETQPTIASMQQTAAAASGGGAAPGPGAPGMAKPPQNATVNITGNQARNFAGAGALPQQQDQLDNLGAS